MNVAQQCDSSSWAKQHLGLPATLPGSAATGRLPSQFRLRLWTTLETGAEDNMSVYPAAVRHPGPEMEHQALLLSCKLTLRHKTTRHAAAASCKKVCTISVGAKEREASHGAARGGDESLGRICGPLSKV